MLNVRVRFDKKEEAKTMRVDGEAESFPEVGKEFSFFVPAGKNRFEVQLGRVINLKSFGDMTLVQTDLIVAEVWFLGGELEIKASEVLPFVRDNKTLFLKGGKLTTLKRAGASRRVSLIKFNNLMKALKDDSKPVNHRPSLRLIKGDILC